MTKSEAIEILKRYQVWRRYDGPLMDPDSPDCPPAKLIGEAIDIVINDYDLTNKESVFGLSFEDYMCLPKERLAELLVEKDRKSVVPPIPEPQPVPFVVPSVQPPCFSDNGICTNPHHDCINCPKIYSTGGQWSTNAGGTTIKPNE